MDERRQASGAIERPLTIILNVPVCSLSLSQMCWNMNVMLVSH